MHQTRNMPSHVDQPGNQITPPKQILTPTMPRPLPLQVFSFPVSFSFNQKTRPHARTYPWPIPHDIHLHVHLRRVAFVGALETHKALGSIPLPITPYFNFITRLPPLTPRGPAPARTFFFLPPSSFSRPSVVSLSLSLSHSEQYNPPPREVGGRVLLLLFSVSISTPSPPCLPVSSPECRGSLGRIE